MNSAENFETSHKPYCRCCGSLELMTVDVSIKESSDWEHQSRLRKERLWNAIGSLDEHELHEFVLDAVPYCNVDEDYEVEAGLHSYLADYGEIAVALDPIFTVGLGAIVVPWDDHILKERKRAFVRLWESFDDKAKASFFSRYLGKNGGPDEVSR